MPPKWNLNCCKKWENTPEYQVEIFSLFLKQKCPLSWSVKIMFNDQNIDKAKCISRTLWYSKPYKQKQHAVNYINIWILHKASVQKVALSVSRRNASDVLQGWNNNAENKRTKQYYNQTKVMYYLEKDRAAGMLMGESREGPRALTGFDLVLKPALLHMKEGGP